MGIYDLIWKEEDSFVTASADNTLKLFKDWSEKNTYKTGFKKIEPHR